MLMLILFVNINCKSQQDEISLIPKLLQNGPNIIYNQFEEQTSNNFSLIGELLFYNVSTGKKIRLLNSTFSNTEIRLINNGKNLVLFRNNPFDKGKISIIYLSAQEYKTISFRKRLNFQNNIDDISQFDIYNDSTIIFGFRDAIYTYGLNTDSLTLLKKFDNKRIGDILYDSKNKKLFFSYQIGLDTRMPKYFGFDLMEPDSITLTNICFDCFGNISPNGKDITMSTYYDTSVVYDVENNKATYYKFMDKNNNVDLVGPYFINDTTLLLSSFKLETPENTDLYSFDLKTVKVLKKITDNHLKKSGIFVYF